MKKQKATDETTVAPPDEETAEVTTEEAPADEAPAEPAPKKPTMITADRKDLLNAIKTAARAIYPRTSLLILEHVHFFAKDGTLYVEATDLERTIVVPVPGFINAGDDFTAHKDTLVKMLSAITNKVVEITITEGKCWEIKAGTDIYEIEGLSAEEFPLTKPIETAASFTIPAQILRKAILRTRECMSKDETQVTAHGMLFESYNGKLALVTTDRHRLAYFESVTDVTGELNAILPFSVAKELAALLESAEGNVKACFGALQATFEIGDTVLYTRLIEGQFLNYRFAIPEVKGYQATVSREELLAAVKKASMIAKESANRVYVHFKDKSVEVSAETGHNRAKVRSVIGATLQGEELLMSFNYGYLEGILASFDTKNMAVELTGQLTAAMVMPVEDRADKTLYLVMPMQPEEHRKAQEAPPVQEEEKVEVAA